MVRILSITFTIIILTVYPIYANQLEKLIEAGSVPSKEELSRLLQKRDPFASTLVQEYSKEAVETGILSSGTDRSYAYHFFSGIKPSSVQTENLKGIIEKLDNNEKLKLLVELVHLFGRDQDKFRWREASPALVERIRLLASAAHSHPEILKRFFEEYKIPYRPTGAGGTTVAKEHLDNLGELLKQEVITGKKMAEHIIWFKKNRKVCADVLSELDRFLSELFLKARSNAEKSGDWSIIFNESIYEGVLLLDLLSSSEEGKKMKSFFAHDQLDRLLVEAIDSGVYKLAKAFPNMNEGEEIEDDRPYFYATQLAAMCNTSVDRFNDSMNRKEAIVDNTGEMIIKDYKDIPLPWSAYLAEQKRLRGDKKAGDYITSSIRRLVEEKQNASDMNKRLLIEEKILHVLMVSRSSTQEITMSEEKVKKRLPYSLRIPRVSPVYASSGPSVTETKEKYRNGKITIPEFCREMHKLNSLDDKMTYETAKENGFKNLSDKVLAQILWHHGTEEDWPILRRLFLDSYPRDRKAIVASIEKNGSTELMKLLLKRYPTLKPDKRQFVALLAGRIADCCTAEALTELMAKETDEKTRRHLALSIFKKIEQCPNVEQRKNMVNHVRNMKDKTTGLTKFYLQVISMVEAE